MTLQNLKDLYVEQLRDLYSAENQILKALPKMEKAASHEELRNAFREHLEITEKQVERLDQIFEKLGMRAGGERCKAMEGLIAEGEEMISMKGEDDVRDAGLIAAAQRIEHYEIAGYGCVRTYARMLHEDEAARLLQQTLDEEGNADEELTQLAESIINIEAARS